MKSRAAHPSEQELLMAVDRELSAPEMERVQAHLTNCSICRDRSLDIERIMVTLVRTRDESIGAQLPPVDRALERFQAAISRLSLHEQEPKTSTGSQGFAARLAHVAAALLFAIGALLVASRELRPPRQSSYVPRSSLTPGDAVLFSKNEVCEAGKGTDAQVVPASLKQAVFREYGMASARPQDYEVDYLITPQLGGATSLRNLWPEPYSAEWNARVKDQLEDRLHDMVCHGDLDLRTAQHDISSDWVSAYRKYFHASQPLVSQ